MIRINLKYFKISAGELHMFWRRSPLRPTDKMDRRVFIISIFSCLFSLFPEKKTKNIDTLIGFACKWHFSSVFSFGKQKRRRYILSHGGVMLTRVQPSQPASPRALCYLIGDIWLAIKKHGPFSFGFLFAFYTIKRHSLWPRTIIGV